MKSMVMDIAKLQDETVYFDINDVLDILPTNKPNIYDIVFFDGELWKNAKIYKRTFNKFVRLKEKRGQKDERM